jgi:uncharacterized protein YkwD
MSWASHPTSEMPPNLTGATGRHRARNRTVLGIAAIALLVLLLIAAMFSPTLFGWPPPATEPRAAPPTVETTTATTPTESPTVSVADSEALENEVVTLTNSERAAQGCDPLRLDAALAAAARAHSVDMAQTGSFGHPGADGTGPAERMNAAGYDTGRGWAENIARGQATADAVMAAWMGSAEHRANILDCGLLATGVGAARGASGQVYWTQDFGRT